MRHNGFPVLYPNGPDGLPPRGGNLAGLIYRKHLCVLLSHGSQDPRVFRAAPTAEEQMRLARAASVGAKVAAGLSTASARRAPSAVSLESGQAAPLVLEWQAMEGNFPRYPKVSSIHLTEAHRYAGLLRPSGGWVARGLADVAVVSGLCVPGTCTSTFGRTSTRHRTRCLLVRQPTRRSGSSVTWGFATLWL